MGLPQPARLRNRERDRSRLGITSRGRGYGDGVIASGRSADGRLRRTLAACWNQQKHAEYRAECQNSRDAPPTGVTANAEQHQSGKRNPERVKVSPQEIRGTRGDGPRRGGNGQADGTGACALQSDRTARCSAATRACRQVGARHGDAGRVKGMRCQQNRVIRGGSGLSN